MTDEEDTEQNGDSEVSTRKNINESHDKVRMTWKGKRGTGTRDQDEFDLKVRGDDPEEVVRKMGEAIGYIEGAEDMDGLMDRVRDIQPDEGDDDD